MNDDLNELMELEIQRQGVFVASVADGHVLMFTRAVLERLLKASADNEDGRVVVQIKRGAQS